MVDEVLCLHHVGTGHPVNVGEDIILPHRHPELVARVYKAYRFLHFGRNDNYGLAPPVVGDGAHDIPPL